MATLAAKLQLKPGMKMRVMNATQGMESHLRARLDDVTLGTVRDMGDITPDAVMVFVSTLAEALELAPEAFRVVAPGGLAWVAYPKGASGVETDINRDILWAELESTGWRPVRQIALDEVWSAIRYRPAEDVGR